MNNIAAYYWLMLDIVFLSDQYIMFHILEQKEAADIHTF